MVTYGSYTAAVTGAAMAACADLRQVIQAHMTARWSCRIASRLQAQAVRPARQPAPPARPRHRRPRARLRRQQLHALIFVFIIGPVVDGSYREATVLVSVFVQVHQLSRAHITDKKSISFAQM